MKTTNNIFYLCICLIIGLMLCGCSSFKSSYMGSQGEDFYYVYNDNWTRSDPYYYYWTLEEGNEWYIAQNIKTKKRGVVNKSRQKLIPIIYTNLIYQNGAFIVADEAGKYYAAYDLNGNCIINFDKKFTQIEAMNKIIYGKSHLYFKCRREFSDYLCDKYGNEQCVDGYYYDYTTGFFWDWAIDKDGRIFYKKREEPKATTVAKNETVERDNYKWLSTSNNSTKKKGATSTTGTTIVPANYTKVEYIPYYDGYFVVWDGSWAGIYNTSGKSIIPVSRGYSSITKTSSDGRIYYRVCKNGYYGACDINGREIIVPKYCNLILYNGVFYHKDSNGNWIALSVGIDTNNKVVNRPSYKKQDVTYYEIVLEQNLLEEAFGKNVKIEQISSNSGRRAFKMVFDDKILFEFAKADLNSAARSYIDKVATVLKKLPSTGVIIKGYTDNIGSLETNQQLSTQRAEAVGSRLVSNGISNTRISTIGIPLSDYVASNDTEWGRAQNRRVEIIVEDGFTASKAFTKTNFSTGSEDKFENINKSYTWASERKIYDDWEDKYAYGTHTISFDLKVPTSLNGINIDIANKLLTYSLLETQNHNDFNKAINYVKNNFSMSHEGIRYKLTNTEYSNVSHINSGWTEYSLYPYISSSNLIGFALYIHNGGYGGNQGTTSYEYITLVRNASNNDYIIKNNQIFNSSATRANILKLINQQITALNKRSEYGYDKAERVPNNIRIGKNGISFIFDNYEIGPGAAGCVHIEVSYDKLKPYLNPSFYKLITTSTNWESFDYPFKYN